MPLAVDSNATDAATAVAAVDSDATATGLDPPHSMIK